MAELCGSALQHAHTQVMNLGCIVGLQGPPQEGTDQIIVKLLS